jgi:hypothetical protein
MTTRSILFGDNIHINEKNFSSFLGFLKSRDVQIFLPVNPPFKYDCYGHYEKSHIKIASKIQEYDELPEDKILTLMSGNLLLIEIYRAELLSAIIPICSDIFSLELISDHDLISLALEKHRTLLHINIAVASLWIDYWREHLKTIPSLAYIAVFSGSLSYARALLGVAKLSPARCFVLESLFTGHHYFCEERYFPIANRSDIRHDTVFISKNIDDKDHNYEVKRNHALKFFSKINNKNVKQPITQGNRIFPNNGKTLLIIGQVANDFSLIETSRNGICSFNVYYKIIEEALDVPGWRVIFKAHPWENKKNNLRTSLTKNLLDSKFSEYKNYKSVENYNINDLFEEANLVVCINTQAGIEAAAFGFKPIQLGDAFWGNRGFSIDLCLSELSSFGTLLSLPSSGRLNWQEYRQFERWWTTLLSKWVVEETTSPQTDAKLSQLFFELPRQAIRPINNASPNFNQSKLELGYKKFKKLLRNPKTFFRDSKHSIFRIFGKFI